MIKIGPLTINTEKYEVAVDNDKVLLTTTEFKILEVLAEGKGRVFTRDQLLKKKRLWGTTSSFMTERSTYTSKTSGKNSGPQAT
jgi:DNA-binding response OmpR family regulator